MIAEKRDARTSGSGSVLIKCTPPVEHPVHTVNSRHLCLTPPQAHRQLHDLPLLQKPFATCDVVNGTATEYKRKSVLSANQLSAAYFVISRKLEDA